MLLRPPSVAWAASPADTAEFSISGSFTEEEINAALLDASDLVFSATGRQFGTNRVSLIPYEPWQAGRRRVRWPMVYQVDVPADRWRLPYRNLIAVEEVTRDGVVYHPSKWEVVNGWLINLDGDWPDPTTIERFDDSTWSITVAYGRPINGMIQTAVAQTATELLRAQVGLECGLPANAVSMTRRGLTISLDAKNLTAAPSLAKAIGRFNPDGFMRPARVYRADARITHRAIQLAGGAAVGVEGAGPPGPQGLPGARGERWWTGEGPPGTIVGALPGDIYLDRTAGIYYELA